MNDAIRVLIVDDHPIVREGLRALIESISLFELAGEAVDGADAVEKAAQTRPDVILMDLLMPNMDGITAIQHIMQHNPQARILVLTSFAEDENIYSAIKAGAKGYLLKDSPPPQLIQSIQTVFEGDTSFHPSVTSRLLQAVSEARSDEKKNILTEREVEVLRLLAQGLSNETIAEKLGLSKQTARTHVGNILSKLKLENRTQAALYALREGYIHLDEIE